MANSEIHVGDTGIDFLITVMDGTSVLNLSLASATVLRLQKPSGEYITRNMRMHTNGTDGKLVYTFVGSDLDQEGTWRFQIYLIVGAEQKSSNISRFKVYPNLPLEL